MTFCQQIANMNFLREKVILANKGGCETALKKGLELYNEQTEKSKISLSVENNIAYLERVLSFSYNPSLFSVARKDKLIQYKVQHYKIL